MLISELLNIFKSTVNQHASTGFYDNANDLYVYLNQAQNFAVGFTVKQLAAKQKGLKYYRSRMLEPLEAIGASTATTINVQEYSLPADYLFTQHLECDVTNGGTLYPAVFRSLNEALFRQRNPISKATATEPAYYTRANMLGLLPVPTVSSTTGYKHYYYKKPREIIAANSALVVELKDEMIQAVLQFALYYALIQDNRQDVGITFYNSAVQTLTALD